MHVLNGRSGALSDPRVSGGGGGWCLVVLRQAIVAAQGAAIKALRAVRRSQSFDAFPPKARAACLSIALVTLASQALR